MQYILKKYSIVNKFKGSNLATCECNHPFKDIGYNFIYTIENNKAKKTIVETGYTQNGMIEIVNGLNVNQTVINEGGRIVKGGQNVKIYNNNE